MKTNKNLSDNIVNDIKACLENAGLDILKMTKKRGCYVLQTEVDFGYLKISDTEPKIDEMLTIIQHPRGRPKEIEAGYFVKNSGKWMSYSDLDTEPGSSGSGVINNNGELVGVHTNGGCDENGGVNYAMNIKSISKLF